MTILIALQTSLELGQKCFANVKYACAVAGTVQTGRPERTKRFTNRRWYERPFSEPAQPTACLPKLARLPTFVGTPTTVGTPIPEGICLSPSNYLIIALYQPQLVQKRKSQNLWQRAQESQHQAEEGNLAEFAAGEDECLEEDEAGNEEGDEEQNDEEEGGEEDSDDGEEQEEEEEDEAEPQQRSSRHRGKQPRMEATHNRDGSKRARRN